MKKVLNAVTSIMTIVILLATLTFCDKQQTAESTRSAPKLKFGSDSTKLETILRKIVTLQFDFITTLVNSQIDTTTLRRLYKDKKFDSLYYLLNMDSTKIACMTQDLTSSLDSLVVLIPSIKDSSCNCANLLSELTPIINVIQYYRENPTVYAAIMQNCLPNRDSQNNNSGCYWLQYGLCDAACILEYGEWLPWLILCHTNCWCNYCWGGAHQYICGGSST
jgi:hypothetical protein